VGVVDNTGLPKNGAYTQYSYPQLKKEGKQKYSNGASGVAAHFRGRIGKHRKEGRRERGNVVSFSRERED